MNEKLPDGWVWKKLGEIIDIYDNKRIPLKENERSKRKGNYPYCGANGIIDYVDDFIFDGKYVLLAEDGGYWNARDKSAYIMKGKFWVNNHAHILQSKPDILYDEYLVRALNYLDLSKYISGSTRGKLVQKSMNSIVVPVPPLDVQQKIVSILEKAEETKRLRAQADELTQQLLKSVFLEMFGNPRTNPMNWKTYAFNDIIEEFRYGSSNKSSEDGYPILRIPNVVDGEINLNDLKYCQLTPKEYDKLKLSEGDILFVRTNGNQDYVGRCAIVESWHEGFIFASYLIRCKVDKQIVDPRYLKSYFETGHGKNLLKTKTKTSAGQYNINTEGLGSLPILIPPLDIQLQFHQVYDKVKPMSVQQVQSSQQINTLFDSLMQKAFTGELVS